MTALERAEHEAEWIRITERREASNKGASCADIPRGRGQPKGGINAAVRDLGIDRTEAQRAVKIDTLTNAAKDAARAAGLDDNQSALLAAARAAPDDQAAEIARMAELMRRPKKRG